MSRYVRGKFKAMDLSQGVTLDGYPATLVQSEELAKMLPDVKMNPLVFQLQLPDDVIRARAKASREASTVADHQSADQGLPSRDGWDRVLLSESEDRGRGREQARSRVVEGDAGGDEPGGDQREVILNFRFAKATCLVDTLASQDSGIDFLQIHFWPGHANGPVQIACNKRDISHNPRIGSSLRESGTVLKQWAR